MANRWLLVLVFLFSPSIIFAQQADEVTGLWFMYDLGAKSPSGIIQVYEYDGKIYGRTLLSYENDGTVRRYTDEDLDRAKYLAGNPTMLGLDVIWNVVWNEKKQRYTDGYIMDPRKKSPYGVELYRSEESILKMKGKLGPFGATIDWKKATEADLDGTAPFKNPVPVIYYTEKGKLLSSPQILS